MTENNFNPEMFHIRETQLFKALSACASAYYEFNVTKNIILGKPVCMKDGVAYHILELAGLPEHCAYTQLIAYWGSKLEPKEQNAFLTFFSIEHLLQSYQEGKKHIIHKYWSKDFKNNPKLVEQGILFYQDIDNGDILAFTYVKDLTTINEFERKEEENKRRLEEAIQVEKESKHHALEEERRRNQYRKAIISGAISVYEVNLTQDILERLSLFDEGEEKQMHSFLGSDIPCRFSDFLLNSSQNMPPEVREEFMQNNNRDYLLQCFHDGRLEIQLEYDAHNFKKEYMHVRKTYVLTQDTATGDIFVLIVSKDITEKMEQRRMQEMQMQRQLEIIQALGSEFSSIYLLNLEDETMGIVSTNGKFKTFMRMTDDIDNYLDALSVYSEVAVYPKDKKLFLDAVQPYAIRRGLYDHKVYDVNYRRIAKGTVDYAQLRFIKLDNKDCSEIICAFRSVDEIVKKEIEQQNILSEALKQAKAAEKAKSAFLFNMSHDIRTPMNAIMGFNSLAKKNIDNKEKALDALGKAEIAGKHMLDLINDVLEMARIESGKMRLAEKVINVSDQLTEIEGMFRNDMETKGITFVTDYRYRERYIISDGMRIMQIITNLLSNAMKYTQAGGTVIFQVIEKDKTEDGVIDYEIHVRDNGIGMSQEFQKRLFTAFERENSTTVSGIQGTGLGLAISQNLANMLGGSITCNSELGKGSDFIFSFKAKSAPEQEETSQISDTFLMDEVDFTGKRILLVEDNEFNREIATEFLRDYGLEVETADDGYIAVEMVEHSKPGYYDLVLMDIQMPYMDGYTATREIRLLRNKELSQIPIVAMTANAFDEDRKKVFEAGMNEHITKPIDEKKLTSVLRKILC